MTLKEKFEKANNTFWLRNEAELEKIADDYAIEFVEWKDKIPSSDLLYSSKYAKSNKELLEIFKKEKGL